MNNISELINSFLIYKKDFENRSPKTCDAYNQDLIRGLLPFLSARNKKHINELTKQDVIDFLTNVLGTSKSGSVDNRNRKLATIKSFLKYIEEYEIQYDKNIQKISSIKKTTKTIVYLTEEEKERLISTVENKSTPFYKFRDKAILTLFLGTGIRVSELINLRIKNIEFNSRGENFIYVKRKGGNEEQLPINYKTVTALRVHLSKPRDSKEIPYVFLSRNNKQLEPNSVYALVKHYLQKADIEKKKWGPHILRHTVGVTLRRTGTDIATIQKLLGHKKLETTSIYLNVEAQDLVKAVNSL